MTVGQVLPLAHTNMMAGRKPICIASVLPFAYLLASLKQLYPAARIYNITNSELSEEVTDSMDEICRHYGIENIRLHDIDKQWGHPSVQGMQSIDAQVWESVLPMIGASVSLPAKN